MTATLTLTDDIYSTNTSDGNKTLYFNISLTNPYTAGGEIITVSSYFPNKVHGGQILMVNPSVAVANAGLASHSTFRGTNTSTTSVALQFFNVSLGGATAGNFVDNTVANLSNTTVYGVLYGR